MGSLHALIGSSIVLRGIPASMEPFGIPRVLFESPHYIDAMEWVYVHQALLGLLLVVVGWFGRSPDLKLWFARAVLFAHVVYGYRDFRASDSAVGTGLYEGSSSLAPAFMVVFLALFFIGPSLRREEDPG